MRDGNEAVATSRIERVAQGCVIRETYTQKDGYAGTSLSFHDPTLGKWRQTWVDSTGSVGEFSGEAGDGVSWKPHYELLYVPLKSGTP